MPCWLITWLLMQLFGPRRLGGLDDADALWLYDEVKTLHNSDLNARIMTEVSHRAPLALLLNLLSTATEAGAQPVVHPAVGSARPRAQDGG